MANMMYLGAEPKVSFYCPFKTLNLNVFELMENIFVPIPIYRVNIEHSINNEIMPCFNFIPDGISIVNFPCLVYLVCC